MDNCISRSYYGLARIILTYDTGGATIFICLRSVNVYKQRQRDSPPINSGYVGPKFERILGARGGRPKSQDVWSVSAFVYKPTLTLFRVMIGHDRFLSSWSPSREEGRQPLLFHRVTSVDDTYDNALIFTVC